MTTVIAPRGDDRREGVATRLSPPGVGEAAVPAVHETKGRWRYTAGLVTIMALAAVLRLWGLATNPGWDGDEGYNLNIAVNLAHGHRQMFAYDFVYVQHPPLFFALDTFLIHLIGANMLAPRVLSVLFSLGTLALLWPLGSQLAEGRVGARIALLAALTYAAAPLVVLQNRFGYTYNGLAFWTVLALVALLRYRHTKGRGMLIVCGIAASAALTTDQEGVYLLPVLLFGLRSWRAGLVAVVLALVGPLVYVGAMASVDRGALIFDITHTAGRVGGGSVPYQAALWLYSLADLLRFDLLIPVGLAGLVLIPHRSVRRVVLALLATMLVVILKVRDPNPLFRTAEPIVPLVCLGVGSLGSAAWSWLETFRARRRLPRARGTVALAGLVPALLLVSAVAYDAHAAMTRFPTRIDGLLPRSVSDAQVLAAWVNRRVHPGDLVLAMPQVSWQFHARTAELLQAAAWEGYGAAFYPPGIPRSRWIYSPAVGAARFIVVDAFTHAWIAQNGPERRLVEGVVHSWPLVYARGEYRVYANPRQRHGAV